MNNNNNNNNNNIVQIPATPRIYGAFKNLPISWHDAIKEFVDNSIDAKATFCQIYVADLEHKPGYFDTLEILDNGTGMTKDELKHAWEYGSETSYSDDSHGKFGMGLTASVVKIANHVKIITRRKGGDFYTLEWDMTYARIHGWGVQLRLSTNKEIGYFLKRLTKHDKANEADPFGTLLILDSLTFDFKDGRTIDDILDDGLRIETLRKHVMYFIGVSHGSHIKGSTWPNFDGDSNDRISIHKCKLIFRNTDIIAIDPILDAYENKLSGLISDTWINGTLTQSPNLRVRCFLMNYLDDDEKKKHNIVPKKQFGVYFCRQGRYISLPDVGNKIISPTQKNWHSGNHSYVRVLVSWDKPGDEDISLSFIKNELTMSKKQVDEIGKLVKDVMKLSEAQHKKHKDKSNVSDDHKIQREHEDSILIDALEEGVKTGGIPVPEIVIEKRESKTSNDDDDTPRDPDKDPDKEPVKRTRNPSKIKRTIPQIVIDYDNQGEDGPLFESIIDGNKFIIYINEDTRFYREIFCDISLKHNTGFKIFMYSLACMEQKAALLNQVRHDNILWYLENVALTMDSALHQLENKQTELYQVDYDEHVDETFDDVDEDVDTDVAA